MAHNLSFDAMRVVFGGFFIFMGITLARKGWAIAKNSQGGSPSTELMSGPQIKGIARVFG